MLLLALYFPLYGVVLALYITWHSHRAGEAVRRNAALACLALAVIDLAAPRAVLPHLGL